MTAILILSMLVLVAQDNLMSITGFAFLSYFDEALTILLFIIALLSIKKRKGERTNSSLVWLLIAFIAVGVISCLINSTFVPKNLIMSCFLSIKFWLIVISTSSLKINNNFLDKLYKSLFFVEKIVILFAIINLLFPVFYASLFPASHMTHRFGMLAVCSTFNHPGKYGWFMLFCALAHLSKYNKTKDKKELINIVISIVACLLSLRTKVILSVAICAICYILFLKRNSLKKQLKKISLLVIALACLLIPFRDVIAKTYTLYFTDAEGYSVRQALLDNGVKIANDYFPLGVGFSKYGTWYAARDYSEYYSEYGMSSMYGLTRDNTSYSTDTFWPAVFGETGVLGSIIYISMLIILMKRLLKNCNDKTSDNYDILLLAPLVLVQTFAESFGSASFSSPPEYFFSAIVIGLALATSNQPKQLTPRKANENEKNINI